MIKLLHAQGAAKDGSSGADPALLEQVLEQLGAVGGSQGQGQLPPALQPALEHTLACIDQDARDTGEIDLDSVPGSLHSRSGRDTISVPAGVKLQDRVQQG